MPNLVPQFLKRGADPLQVIPLDFETVVLDRATRTALRLQAAEQSGQVVSIRG
jgi:hypothetical protein